MPTPISDTTVAATTFRSRGSCATTRNPARTPGCTFVAPLPNGRPIDATRSAETRKLAASTAKTTAGDAPDPRTTPPRSGPTRYPADEVAATSAFACATSPGRTRLGIAAAEAGSDGVLGG